MLLGGRVLVFDQYPLQSLEHIDIPTAPSDQIDPTFAGGEPVTEQKVVKARYRVTAKDDSRVSFAPVQRVHQLDTGSLTELVNIELRLGNNEKLRRDFGGMNVGDEKEFQLIVTVVTGFGRIGEGAPTDDQH